MIRNACVTTLLSLHLGTMACGATPAATAAPGFKPDEWSPSTLHFAGRDWDVRESHFATGAGPNRWNADGLRLNTDGALTLELPRGGVQLHAAEVSAPLPRGYCTVCWNLKGSATLDHNAVFSVFLYAGDHSEIDFEVSTWQRRFSDNAQWVMTGNDGAEVLSRFALPLERPSEHCLEWSAARLTMHSTWSGISRSVSVFREDVPTPRPHRVHINLWAIRPSLGIRQTSRVVVSGFQLACDD